MHLSKKLKRDQPNNENTTDECPGSYTQTEKSNSNKKKDDNMMDENPDSSIIWYFQWKNQTMTKREMITR